MTNDTAIVRLLYAILSQKCLKDIDWNKVAHDPVLQQEITNGHAARMRYSRFKKQMDGTASVRKPRNPNSPRKTKNKSPKKEKVKHRKDSDAAERIKEEAGESSHHRHTPVQGTPEADLAFQPSDGGFHGSGSASASVEGSSSNSPFVKREPGSSSCTSRYPSTPLEESTTPASSFNDGGAPADEVDDMYASFGMPGGEYLTEPMMGQHGMSGQQNYGMDMGMAMAGDPYDGLWEPQQIHAEGGVLVKREPRWEPAYRQI